MKSSKKDLLACIKNLIQDIEGLNLHDHSKEDILTHCIRSKSWFSVIRANRILKEYNS